MRGLLTGVAALFIVLAYSPAPCLASSTSGATRQIGACIRMSAGSRRWLETTLWGLYDQEGGWIGAERRNKNGTDDLGPLQVNSVWVPIIAARLHRDAIQVRRWLRDDACFNIGVAAWLFLSGYHRNQDYWGAVGAYHSPTQWRARAYARQVADRLQLRFGAAVFRR